MTNMIKTGAHLNQRRQDHAKTERPDQGDHEEDVHPAVDLVVAAVVGDQHVSDGGEIHFDDVTLPFYLLTVIATMFIRLAATFP